MWLPRQRVTTRSLWRPAHAVRDDRRRPALGRLALGGVRECPARVKCASLAWHTLTSAITNPAEIARPEYAAILRTHD